MGEFILSIDQGTTSSRAIIFDKKARIISMAQQEFKQIYPESGYVEHSAQDIMGSVMAVVAEAVVRADITADDISAIGITNQRETTLVWDKRTGKPVYNAIVWQCRRTAGYCEELKREKGAFIYDKTGLIPDAYFSATKIKWILDNVPNARRRAQNGELLFGTVDTFLIWQMTKGKVFATDYTNAARTMLFNIHTLEWDGELLELFGIPESMLPKVQSSGSFFGYTDKSVLGSPVKICSAVGDQQAALFGQLCTEKGSLKNTYGTGCFLLMNTGDDPVRSKNGLVTTLGASLSDKPPYVLEGSVFVGGAVVQWLRDGLKILETADDSETMAYSVEDSGGVYIVPAFTGLGAPHWDGSARGIICGITRGTSKEHLVRAALEGIAYEVADLVRCMEKDSGINVTRLSVDGGASKNNFLLQFQSDILDCETVRPEVVETTALGAAFLAGLTSGLWQDLDDIRSTVKTGKVFRPDMSGEKRKKLLSGWQKALRQVKAD